MVLRYETIPKLLSKFWQTLAKIIVPNQESTQSGHCIKRMRQEQSEKSKNNQQNLKEDSKLD